MPYESPNLDDLSYAQMRERLIRRIVIHAPEWTDHNESDAGIALIELFAYLYEQLGYRLNQVPEKNYIEFLKLLGVRLLPAEPARTLLSVIINKPETRSAFLMPQGARFKAPGFDPLFETDASLDVVPAQLAALMTTKSEDIRALSAGDPVPSATPDVEQYIKEHFTLLWDGKTPKLKAMPTEPLAAFALTEEAAHHYLWIGLAFNPGRDAGFLGQRVTLTVQLDDDEQPTPEAVTTCGAGGSDLLAPSDVVYHYFRPPARDDLPTTDRFVELTTLADTTAGFTRSGVVRFDVPLGMGPIADDEWQPLRGEQQKTTQQICEEANGTATPLPDPVPHPLIGALKTPVAGAPSAVPISGFIRVTFPPGRSAFSVRGLTFNAVPASDLLTVENERLGRGNDKPGQRFKLAHNNVDARSLQVAVHDPALGQLRSYRQVADFDAMSNDDAVYVLDPEAGELLFPERGAHIPAEGSPVVALHYRHGGGLRGELPAGKITDKERGPSQVQESTNLYAARGGKDAETLAEAKQRARRELKVRDRAVTASDFEFIAKQTPGVRVARTVTIPLSGPLPSDRGPGVDLDTRANGALSLVVVPDSKGPYPTPTQGMLRAVCAHLDPRRLVTTEVHVVSPQYVRLFQITIEIKTEPGYSVVSLRESIAQHLEQRFHVLTGGTAGTGFPFGGSIHHADLMAEVFAVEGVARVEGLEAYFDGFAPATPPEPSPMSWRRERLEPQRLTNCPESEIDTEILQLAPDENVFVDTSDLLVTLADAGAPS